MSPIKQHKIKPLTKKQIIAMRECGKLTSECLEYLASLVRPGVTGLDLDIAAYEFIIKHNARPAFLNYHDYPNTLCVGVNQVIIHGIPNDTPFEEGSIVSLDVGLNYKGVCTDSAITVPIGNVDDHTRAHLNISRKALEKGVNEVKAGIVTGKIGEAIENFVEEYNFEIIDGYYGHGIGKSLHQEPEVPNRGPSTEGSKLITNTAICIEPIISSFTREAVVEQDDWTVATIDGSWSTHFEQTVLILENGHEVLTSHDFMDDILS